MRCTILLKQMTSKYFLWAIGLLSSLLFFSSCLGSSDETDFEYSTDAQIYSFSISSRADTLGLLNTTAFAIDQINGRLFNKETLPYQFHVDSVALNLRGSSAFFDITLRLQEPDSSFSWTEGDSVSIARLNEIVITAQDGESTKRYQFELNIYQQDPYILSWDLVTDNFLTPQANEQKTIALNSRFVSYYKTGSSINAVSSADTDGSEWVTAEIIGLPADIKFSSLKSYNDVLFAIDEAGNVYNSNDGLVWTQVITEFPVVAVYGNLPSATEGGILAVIDDNGTLKYIETNDFTDINIIGEIHDDLPIDYFSSATIASSTSYSVRYIIISGGLRADGSDNNDILILHERDGSITRLISKLPAGMSLSGSTLFFYDDNPYLIVSSSGENSLLFSENYGLQWKIAGENQDLPDDFVSRTNPSVITDSDNYIWIFGGISDSQTQANDVWRGRLNKFSIN